MTTPDQWPWWVSILLGALVGPVLTNWISAATYPMARAGFSSLGHGWRGYRRRRLERAVRAARVIAQRPNFMLGAAGGMLTITVLFTGIACCSFVVGAMNAETPNAGKWLALTAGAWTASLSVGIATAASFMHFAAPDLALNRAEARLAAFDLRAPGKPESGT